MPAADQALSSSRIVVFDTETTGLSPATDHVIEIAALAVEAGRETGRFASLIDPGVPIPEALTRIHGINDEMVRGQPSFADAARAFLDFAGASILAAHNAPYDMAMLFPPLLDAGLEPAGNPVIDTCRLARRLVDAPNYQLTTLAETLGIPLAGAHRAMPDVEACAALLKVCLGRIGETATMADVERISAARLVFARAPRERGPLPEKLLALGEAIGRRRDVEIVYRGGSHGDRPRRITPLYLLEMDGALAVAAVCHLDRSLKNFKLGLVLGARVV